MILEGGLNKIMRRNKRTNNFGQPNGSKVKLKKDYGGWPGGIIVVVVDRRKVGKYHKIKVKNSRQEEMNIPVKYLKKIKNFVY